MTNCQKEMRNGGAMSSLDHQRDYTKPGGWLVAVRIAEPQRWNAQDRRGALDYLECCRREAERAVG